MFIHHLTAESIRLQFWSVLDLSLERYPRAKVHNAAPPHQFATPTYQHNGALHSMLDDWESVLIFLYFLKHYFLETSREL